MSMITSVKARIAVVRERRPFIDHVVRMVEHYGKVQGNALAGAVTYFAFLSFFPILALSFALVGQVSKVYPQAQTELLSAIDRVLPNIIGEGDGRISLDSLESAAPSIFSIGLVLALYSGLGWLSGMRQALRTVFEEPLREKPNFVMGKLRDLLAMLILGSVLIVSVAVSGVATKVMRPILDAFELGALAGVGLWAVAIAIGMGASTVLFFAFFRLLASPDATPRALWSGALLGAVGFEILKQASTFLLGSTAKQPAFQAFGIALILVVWINYFSRVIVYAASWAHTNAEVRLAREARQAIDQAVKGPSIDVHAAAADVRPAHPAAAKAAPAFAAGAAAMLAVVAAVRRKHDCGTPPTLPSGE